MTMKEKQKYKKILSSCIVLSMILTGFATMFLASPMMIVSADDPIATAQTPSLRIYGENDAIYPTHSYKGQNNAYSNDFIYPDETTPFDPGVIEKDSITFNPAWIGHEYGMTSDIGEKSFLRAFYEPGYTHGIDSKMSDWYNDSIYQNTLEEVNHPYGPFDAVVLETTYMTTKPLLSGRDPIMVNEGTRIWLPYATEDSQVPGMDVAGLVYLNDIVYTNDEPRAGPEYPLDQSAIAIEQEYILHLDPASGETDTATFLDHQIKYNAWEDVPSPDHDQIDISVRYTGNPTASAQLEELENNKMQHWEISENKFNVKFFFDRENKLVPNTASYGEPGARWYVRVMYANEDYLRVRLGRYLVEGETFYVDGLRYDIPALYIVEAENDNCMFKFITLQTPYPKCETIWHHEDVALNVHDWSHVPSQYLYNLPTNQNIWVLPPFSDDYEMIDDIGLDRDDNVDQRCVPAAGILLDGPLDGKFDALDFYYIEEYYEERFNSTLAERLNTERENEFWEWYNVYTKPNRYTEFILPNAETTDDHYYELDPHSSGYYYADGNEYFVTTSFYGPNSEVDLNRDGECKYYDEHEIYDRSGEIANTRISSVEMPRVVFEFDAEESNDLYVNEYNNDATVRIYGEDTEDDAFYPTHSWSGSADDFYKDESDPFDPGVIQKDSITFNPAFIGHEYGMTGDVSEKVFLRTFYEPGYHHLADDLMSEWYDRDYTPINNLHEVNHPYGPFDAVVLESTYMMTTGLLEERHPVAVGAGSRIWLPYVSLDDTHYGMDQAGLVWIHDVYNGNINPIDSDDDDGENYLTDGAIAVEQEFILHLNPGTEETDTARFMDHEIQFIGYENTPMPDFDNVDIKVKYVGNPSDIDYLEDIKSQIWEIKEKNKNYHFDRANNKYCFDQPGARWYLRIEYSDNDYMRIRLGRYLYAGETFYVDGVRYDMPAVYVTDDYKFKYITFQTPYPKCDTIWHQNLNLNVHDWSHVPTQYLVNLPENQPIWVLPPYKDAHQLIDDVGLIKDHSCQWCIPAAGLLLDGPIENVYGAGLYGPLQFYYIDETYDERFSTSLAERLITVESDEYWQWYNAFTKPYHYTEFYLPDQETTDDSYYYLDPWTEGYDYDMADGNEYLITSSWYAPNCEEPTKDLTACRDYDNHDILDMMTESPRMAFEHDGTDGTGLYINHITGEPEPGDPVLEYSPGSHNFGRICTEDEGTYSSTFEIWNSGDETLDYTLSESCSWITSISPSSGTSNGEFDTITVTIDTTGLSEGTYSSDITITSNGGSGTFTVSVQIGCVSTDCTVQITDAYISGCNYGYSDLIFDNVENLGAAQMAIDYDEDKVEVTNTITYPSELDLIVTVLPEEGKINIAWISLSTGKTFDTPTTVLTIEFDALVSPDDQAPLTISGSLYNIDSQPIMYTPINGVTYIEDCPSQDVEADFDGSGQKDIIDALYLAQQLTLPYADQVFNGCHPNVNCDDVPSHPLDANILDPLYLAKHLTGAPGYDLYKDGCPKWL